MLTRGNFRAFNITLLVLLLAAISESSCALDQTCVNGNFRHRSATETKALSASERLDQMVLEQIHHMPAVDDEYYDLLHELLIVDGMALIPKATEFMNAYVPNSPRCSELHEAQLLVAAQYVSYADISSERLRSTDTGRLAILALEKAISRRKAAGLEKYEDKSFTGFLTNQLERLNGVNIKDEIISSALERRFDIQISSEELLRFSEYLISVDPTYPSWTSIITSDKDMAETEIDRYYSAYKSFKKS